MANDEMHVMLIKITGKWFVSMSMYRFRSSNGIDQRAYRAVNSQ